MDFPGDYPGVIPGDFPLKETSFVSGSSQLVQEMGVGTRRRLWCLSLSLDSCTKPSCYRVVEGT